MYAGPAGMIQSLADIGARFPRQRSFAGTPLLYNSTVSLQSVQLNTDIVDDRLTRPRGISDLDDTIMTGDDGGSSCSRCRQKSECTDGTITPPLTLAYNS